MQLVSARIRGYRSVKDSGEFAVEPRKTILVGINEAGKTALIKALQTIKPPAGTDELDALRDYPRSEYEKIQTGRVRPESVCVAFARFQLDSDDRDAIAQIAPDLANISHYRSHRYLNNTSKWSVEGVPMNIYYRDVQKDLARLRAHLVKQSAPEGILSQLDGMTADQADGQALEGEFARALDEWLDTAYTHVDEDDGKEEARFDRLRSSARYAANLQRAANVLGQRLPLFVYYSTYFTVRPRIHLASFAAREESGDLDVEYDFGNQCLLKLLGFTAKELSELAQGAPPDVRPAHQNQEQYQAEVEAYTKRIDERQYRLNAASVSLTKDVRRVWGDEQVTLRLVSDGQLLKVVVVDDLGVEIELDQRSEGFRWLVSFFVVFKAQAGNDLKDAILLLDEPGVSLHALKQQEFRKTVSLLGEDNQILYTTHSPFMIGTDELDLVRIVEMVDRETGTKVHDRIAVDDPRSIFPLQAALGYELAQSLFAQPRNLVCEGLTDMLYVEALSLALKDDGKTALRDGVALVPAHSASKVLYYSTLLTSQGLKVAALLDSDAAGEQAASQDELVRLLRPKEILRTKDHYAGPVSGPEIEDLLRDSLVKVAKDELGWDVETVAQAQPGRPIVDIFTKEISNFSKYRLARAFLRWLGTHSAADLTDAERTGAESLFKAANKALA